MERASRRHWTFWLESQLHTIDTSIRRRGPRWCVFIRSIRKRISVSSLPRNSSFTAKCVNTFDNFEQLGGSEVFEPFLRFYLDHYKFQSIDSDDFKSCLFSYFASSQEKVLVVTGFNFKCQYLQIAALEAVDWNEWLYGTGLPPVIPEFVIQSFKVFGSINTQLRQPAASRSE